jgi:RNA polymerase sigma factor (sigma-70 family)
MSFGVPRFLEFFKGELMLQRKIELGQQLCTMMQGHLHLFLMGRVHPNDVDDVLNETLKAIFLSLETFRGNTDKQFFAWCYRIARNKVSDHYRKDRLEPFPTEELWALVDAAATETPLSPQVKADLEYAMSLLGKTKPQCCKLLWDHFMSGMDIGDLAQELDLNYDAVRRRIERCLDTARKLLAD